MFSTAYFAKSRIFKEPCYKKVMLSLVFKLRKYMIYIFEGMDNCLKDTLIQLFRFHLSPKTQTLKFSNPPKNINNPEDWQKTHFKDMFDLISLSLANSSRNMILNRAHLGEYVYSPIYRGYEGNFIFDLEETFLNICNEHNNKIKLFVIYDSDNFQLKCREDGKSLSNNNYQKMDFERKRFIEAFKRSKFSHKKLFDISDYIIDKNETTREIDTNLIIKSMLKL
jgi:hypothetical protein